MNLFIFSLKVGINYQILLQFLDKGEEIGLKHFKPIKPLGSGDTGRYVFCHEILMLRVNLPFS